MLDGAISATIEDSEASTYLTLLWADGRRSHYHYVWLRDNCQALLEPLSGQRQLLPSVIPGDVHPSVQRILPSCELEIRWAHDGHVSRFDLAWLQRHDYSSDRPGPRPLPERILWDAQSDLAPCEFEYGALFEKPEELARLRRAYGRYGYARVQGAPKQAGTVDELACWLNSPLRVLSGGRFEILGTQGATVALGYTTHAIPCHTDEAYLGLVFDVLLLHCLRNDGCGGLSWLTDGYRVADALRQEDPKAFELLATQALRFEMRASVEHGLTYETEAPLIELDVNGAVRRLRFSNQSIKPIQLPFDRMEPYYKAYRRFSAMASSPEFQWEIPFAPGDIIMVDNYRLLHGRSAFSGGDARRVEACYFSGDGLRSHLRALDGKHPIQGEASPVG